MPADLPNQLALWDPPVPVPVEDIRFAREALAYALAQRSRGCPYAPEWTAEEVVGRVGPLLARLREVV